jgi:Mrp family chromosome partitioning ATPase/capsular polysaccharide biosynthesis protein
MRSHSFTPTPSDHMSTDANGRRQGAVGSPGEDPIEVGRYLEALRRNRWLILSIVAVVTGAAIAVSLAMHKTYNATASIVVDNASGLVSSSESQQVTRNLQTTAALATSASVLSEAATAIPGETRAGLQKRVSASVAENANIINIKVSYRNGAGAATLAYAVARAFLTQHSSSERAQTATALSLINDQIAAVRARAAAEPSVAAQLSTLEARAAELEAASARAGSELQLIQRPEVPSSPSSPRPLRNAVIALFASIFLAVLIVLGREQLTPRVTSQREISQMLGLPVLSGIPYLRRRVDARYARAEYETYQTLSAALRLALPPTRHPHVMLVTSATHGEGKTTVTMRLGRVLAQSGHKTLVISGDLRWPKLDDALRVGGRPGVRELLTLNPEGRSMHFDEVAKLIVPAGGEIWSGRGELDVLPAGRHGGDASELLHTPALPALIEALRESNYAYVLVDSPPILGVADAQMLAQFCDEVLVVSRLDRLRTSDAVEMRETLDRLDANAVGIVVLGTRLAGSPYYAADAIAGEPAIKVG